MKLFYYLGLIVFLLFASGNPAMGQDYSRMRQELQEQQQRARSNIDNLRKQIETIERQISQTGDEYTRVFQDYQNLEREIALRDEVIVNLEEEGRHLIREIDINRQSINELTEDLQTLIETYQNTLAYLYKSGRIPDMALLFTAESINQMLIRSYFLNKFQEYRNRQADQITEAQEELEATRGDLLSNLGKNDDLLGEKQTEQNRLQERKEQLQEIVELARHDVNALSDEKSSKESELRELESTFNELLEEEARVREAESNRLRQIEAERRRRLAEAEDAGDEAAIARYSAPVRSASLPSEEDFAVLEESFGSAKGNMPWPVEYGAISARFGNKVNPLYGTEVNNPGVEIATEARSPVRVVHEGFVYAVRSLPGFGTCIFVKHGRYITVYGNLSEVRVRRETTLQAGDIIALSGDDNSLKGQALFFMVREGDMNLDPEQWITRN
ncbi:MAG: peptidoglycan DD-metalloendopeptidase family protein [Balneolales bacterium]